MKLFIVLGIQEFREELIDILNNADLTVFSEVEVRGFKKEGVAVDPSNWFGSSVDPDYSTMFMAFVEEEKIATVMEDIKNMNQNYEGRRPYHAFQMPVEKFV